jgi:K(+)-stimulated pyrophosphate-energized sodium pump
MRDPSRMHLQSAAVIAPMIIGAVGTLLSIAGIYMVRTKEGATCASSWAR